MNGRVVGVLVLASCFGLGILTAVPALFNFVGLAMYVALMRECSKHVIPWRWARRAMRLDKMRGTANPAPPPVERPLFGPNMQVTEFGNGAGLLIYPDGRQTEKS